MVLRLLLLWALPAAAELRGLEVRAHRPAATSWRRTQCGGPSGDADIPTEWGTQITADEAPLSKYPRPQMVRGGAAGLSAAALRDEGGKGTWASLNGLWEWEQGTQHDESAPPYGKTLSGSILVPFPVESCLSGVAPKHSKDIVKYMWYRLSFDAPSLEPGKRTLLHFGAVDWQTEVHLNGAKLGNHTGGYDGFSFEVTSALKQAGNELLIRVFDPSDSGPQPNGKQRISAIDGPGGDTYTPNSGIWQTVWLESVPQSYIQGLELNQASRDTLVVSAAVVGDAKNVSFQVLGSDGSVLASASAAPGQAASLKLAQPKLWSPASPQLYDLKVSTDSDEVLSYFGLRTFELGEGPRGRRPLLNGEFTFMAGFLDQSWWPDGQYTAPSDAALESDLKATKDFGLNMIRLHQKINPERWYYHADRLGLAVFQDMVQKYGGGHPETVPLFVQDMRAAILGRKNHPCIVQWTAFNEADCWQLFKEKPYDVAGVVALAKELDPTRLVDTDSGGGANNLKIADVNDIHSYPYPGNPMPSATQYAMVGEFGGIGAFIEGKEWVPGKCHTYLKVDTAELEASKYVEMAKTIQSRVEHLSASVYTQTTDVELECDGFLNYDRTSKFNEAQTKSIRDANQAIIDAGGAPPEVSLQI